MFRWVVWSRLDVFFLSEIFNYFSRSKTCFRNFLVLCIFCLWWLAFEFAPSCGSSATVSDRTLTNQDLEEVEHVRTSLLSSSLAEIRQFQSECFLSVFLRFIFRWLQGPSSKVGLTRRVFRGVVWSRLEVFFCFSSEVFKLFPIETYVFGRSSFFRTFCL